MTFPLPLPSWFRKLPKLMTRKSPAVVMCNAILGYHLRETKPEQEYNGRIQRNFSVIPFPVFWANLSRYTQNIGRKFRKMSVPFASPPGISGLFWSNSNGPHESGCSAASRPQSFAVKKKLQNKMQKHWLLSFENIYFWKCKKGRWEIR